MKVKLNNVRLAFPQLFEAKTVNGEGEPAFSASFIIEKDNPAVAEIRKAMEALATEKWGAKAADIWKGMKASDKLALHDGDSKSQYAGFEGNFYVSARSKTRPLVIDANKSPLTASDGKPYAGCYVNAVVELWAQDNNYGKRINASLGGVQFHADGEPFAGGVAASADDFEAVAGTEGSKVGDPAASVFD